RSLHSRQVDLVLLGQAADQGGEDVAARALGRRALGLGGLGSGSSGSRGCFGPSSLRRDRCASFPPAFLGWSHASLLLGGRRSGLFLGRLRLLALLLFGLLLGLLGLLGLGLCLRTRLGLG